MTSARQPIALSNIVIGLGTMGVGIVLALSTLGLVEAYELLRFWPVMLIVLGAAMVAQALWNRGATPAATGEERGYGWFVILVVAISIISFADQRRGEAVAADGRVANVHAVMGRQEKVATGGFRSGTMTGVMGRSVLDLGNASLAPGEEAVIDVLALMGRLEVRVPASWEIDMRTVTILGGTDRPPIRRAREDDTSSASPVDTPAAPRPRLVVRGIILMGAMRIDS